MTDASRSKIDETLPRIVSETFEGMAFLDVCMVCDPPVDLDNIEWLWAKVEMNAPLTGNIYVVLPAELAEAIAYQIHGEIEKQLLDQIVADSLGEIANTIAGGLLGLLTPQTGSLSLGLPDTGKGLPKASPQHYFYFIADETYPIIMVVDLSLVG